MQYKKANALLKQFSNRHLPFHYVFRPPFFISISLYLNYPFSLPSGGLGWVFRSSSLSIPGSAPDSG